MNARLARLIGPSPTLFVLRLALTLAWAGITLSALVSTRVAEGGSALVAGVVALVFLGALWASLAGAPYTRTTARTVILLVVQLVSGILLATDLMFLVAITLPLVLRDRDAVVGFVVLTLLVMLVGFAEARFGTFYAAPELAAMPRALQVWITMGMTAGWLLLSFAGGLLAGTEIRARREVARLVAELRLTNQRLEDTSREAERLHIARELHDTVGHRLAALGVTLDLESRRATGESAASLREAREQTQQLLAEVRQVVSGMRQERPVDLKRDLAGLISGIGALKVDLTVSPGLAVREPAAAHALLRAAQEALTNVLRHAGASHVAVSLRQDEGGVTLLVRDDGHGALGLREGHGLRGMRERLEPLGGTLSVTSRPGAGFELVAWIPVERGS